MDEARGKAGKRVKKRRTKEEGRKDGAGPRTGTGTTSEGRGILWGEWWEEGAGQVQGAGGSDSAARGSLPVSIARQLCVAPRACEALVEPIRAFAHAGDLLRCFPGTDLGM